MKHINFKKVLMMFALVAIVENGAVITADAATDTGSYSEDGGVAPCSDRPEITESYD